MAVDLELGQLVGGERILDGQLVQPELRLQDAQVLLGRLVKADPDEVTLLARPQGTLAELDLGNPAAAAIGIGGDDATHGCPHPIRPLPRDRAPRSEETLKAIAARSSDRLLV